MNQSDYIRVLFDPQEYACMTDSVFGVRALPVKSGIRTSFTSVNPIRPGLTRRDINCSSLRNFLLEIDGMPLEDQRPYLESLAVPYSTLVYSGGKSIHAVICLQTPAFDLAEYHRLACWLHRAVKQADHSTKNPSRLTRFPGVYRRDTKKEQTLLYVGGRITNDAFNDWLRGSATEPRTRPLPTPLKTCSDSLLRGQLRKSTWKCVQGYWRPRQRNNSLFKAACDFAEQQYQIEEAVSMLGSTFPFIDEYERREFENTIRSAYTTVQSRILSY